MNTLPTTGSKTLFKNWYTETSLLFFSPPPPLLLLLYFPFSAASVKGELGSEYAALVAGLKMQKVCNCFRLFNVQCRFTPTEIIIRDAQGRPPRLLHSSWTLIIFVCYSQTTAKHYCSGYHQVWMLYTDYSKALLQRLSSSLNAIHRIQQSITAAVIIKSERYTQNTAKHYCSGYHQVWTLYTDYSKALLQRLSSSLNAIHRLQQSITAAVIIKSERYTQIQQSITAAVIIKSERYTQNTAKHYCSGYHQVWTLFTDYSKALLQRLSSSLNAIHRLQQSIAAAVIIKSERYTQTTAKHYCSGYHQVWTLYTDYSKASL